MKNVFRFLGIIVLAAVIGFSMTACSDDGDGGNNGGNNGGNSNDPNGGNNGDGTTTTYTVTFNTNGGSGTPPPAQTVQAGYTITLPGGSGITRTGYTFGGWNTDTSGTGTNYNAGASYTVNGSITLYSRWRVSDPGIYVGLIKFAGMADDLTNNTPILLDSTGKTALTDHLNTKYVIDTQSGTAMFYGVHKALANLKSNEASYPAKLDSVNIITFTDGLDNASDGRSAFTPIEGSTFDDAAEYKIFISDQITTRKIAGQPITAYSVGVKGNDVNDDAAFQSNLKAIASDDANASLLNNFDDLEDTFNGIAEGLNITHTSTNFTLITTLLSNGVKVRMTFDVTATDSASAATSSKYIEGVINRSGTTYTFTNITYSSGISSDQSNGPITGTVNGSEVNFKFTDVKGYSADTDTNIKQWLMSPGASTWQINSEYSSVGSTTSTVEKHSVIIYLVLDCSTSLNTTEIGQIRTAAAKFINSMYDRYNNQ
jgi:uncharacterized repeat protein (TIGR02543 family)